jgi:hypothetical protein
MYDDEWSYYAENTARFVERIETNQKEELSFGFDLTQTRYMDCYTESKSEMY